MRGELLSSVCTSRSLLENHLLFSHGHRSAVRWDRTIVLEVIRPNLFTADIRNIHSIFTARDFIVLQTWIERLDQHLHVCGSSHRRLRKKWANAAIQCVFWASPVYVDIRELRITTDRKHIYSRQREIIPLANDSLTELVCHLWTSGISAIWALRSSITGNQMQDLRIELGTKSQRNTTHQWFDSYF